MSFVVGIVGLPNVGKSTLFKALTKKQVDIAPRPFTTINPNIGIVEVPDQRLEKIAEIVGPEKVIPAFIKFIDIAGLIKGAHKGEGLGNQFLAEIRNCDIILEVVRAFENIEAENVSGKIDPQNDIETIKTELELKDLEIKERKKPPVKNEEEEEDLLAQKPVIYLLNTDNKADYVPPKTEYLALNLKEEMEITELSEAEKKELGLNSKLDHIVNACYNILDLITFFTIVGQKETRAWALKKGLKAPEAGKIVHTDFKEKFIRAEVINWQKLIELKDWKQAKEKGEIKTVGKDYVVQDGDIVEFKI